MAPSSRSACAKRSVPPAPPTATISASRLPGPRKPRHQVKHGRTRPERPGMYRYDEFDHDFVQARVAEFSDQVARRLAGEITEDQFRPLRLMNGVYLQLHAYML